MLARHLRLRRSQDFSRLREEGRRWQSNKLILNVLPNGLPHNRFGFIVSRRIGNAVTRNQLKRRLRAAVQSWLSNLPEGYDVVIIARQSAAAITYHQLVTELGRLFVLARLLEKVHL
ncbi:MAG: ribonuclease P protein component [Anaerolineae bacterium]|nr:ribonuclease P protein component [Anaerolineae bacterium]